MDGTSLRIQIMSGAEIAQSSSKQLDTPFCLRNGNGKGCGPSPVMKWRATSRVDGVYLIPQNLILSFTFIPAFHERARRGPLQTRLPGSHSFWHITASDTINHKSPVRRRQRPSPLPFYAAQNGFTLDLRLLGLRQVCYCMLMVYLI